MAGTGGFLGWLGGFMAAPAGPPAPLPDLALPSAEGPLVWMRVGAGYDQTGADEGALAPALIQLLVQMRRAGLQIVVSRENGGPPHLGTRGVAPIPDFGGGADQAGAFLDAIRPAAVLLIGADPPRSLIAAAEARDIPSILAEARLPRPARGWSLPGLGRRSALGQMTRLLLPDQGSRDAALHLGAPDERIEVTGPITLTREPLKHNEAERQALAEAFQGRQLWLSLAATEAELDPVIAAHLTVLGYSHRALLILMPADPASAPAMAARMAGAGLIVAQRSLDEDPTEEVNVYLVDDPFELGLWYRVVPLCFMGTTLAGPTEAARDPFEAAALGSAVIHGPQEGRFGAEWAQLDGAAAARRISDAAGLPQAVVSLLAPDQAAILATNAWAVSTGGAGVANRIAQAIRATISREST
ncbi:MAG: glycosyltransferase N-terminal domain-containing protein [Paracoccus sp. (in: a-proteobacteria)]|nr:glycosyltransferase N-terminal domain-containing protein [Paracoccus sp. (in: a-proteobacteria)]